MRSIIIQATSPGALRASIGAVARRLSIVGASALAVLALTLPSATKAQTADDRYAVATWAGPIFSATPSTGNRVNNQTLRQIAHISVGGTKLRVRLSNRWGTTPLVIGAAQIAQRTTTSSIDPSTSRPLTFGGQSSFSIPPGAELVSDWVELTVPDLVDLAVDTYLPNDTSATGSVLSVRTNALQTNYIATGAGNFVGANPFPASGTRTTWEFLAAIDVVNTAKKGGLVAFGDSITEGFRSTSNANARWPDVVARRLVAAGLTIGVSNAGIGGNRATAAAGSTNPSGMSRFDPEAIAATGATHVIVLLGINDDNGGASGADVIAALQQLVIRARTHQLKIYMGTITPEGNATDAQEAQRQVMNNWIRTTRDIDGYIDFDAVIRDPANPRRMRNDLQSGDQLHPNDAGYTVMGNAVDLSIFQ